MTGSSEKVLSRGSLLVALVTSFFTVWMMVVRDDGNGVGFFLLIMAAVVGGFSAWFRPAGMARTMLGIAIMQALLGALIATAPSTASVPGGAFKALLFSAIFRGSVAGVGGFLSHRREEWSQGGGGPLGVSAFHPKLPLMAMVPLHSDDCNNDGDGQSAD